MNEKSIHRHKCPVCGKFVFPSESSFEICPFCDWMDDQYQIDYPDDDGGANNISLNEAKKRWMVKQKNS